MENTIASPVENITSYFLESDFSEESLNYIRLDLFTRKMQYKREYDFLDNQAQMFARLAEAAKGHLEACNNEYAGAEKALAEVRKNKVS
jgi:hypothetical protein